MAEIEVIPNGYVKFLDIMGDDLAIVNDARQSFDITHKELVASDAGLIHYLVKNRHGTPTEAVTFKFQIKAPIPVAREWMRHRFSSFNEVSGRYVKLKPEFYYPDKAAIRTQTGKPGYYIFKPIEDNGVVTEVAQIFRSSYNDAYTRYERLLELGVAKELARNVLSQGLFTTFTYTANARSLMNFLSLRNHSTAMYEIRQYAVAIEEIFKEYLPITHAAFVEGGRVAP